MIHPLLGSELGSSSPPGYFTKVLNLFMVSLVQQHELVHFLLVNQLTEVLMSELFQVGYF